MRLYNRVTFLNYQPRKSNDRQVEIPAKFSFKADYDYSNIQMLGGRRLNVFMVNRPQQGEKERERVANYRRPCFVLVISIQS